MKTKTEVTGIRKNIMGTISVSMKVPGMRKTQEFIIYPVRPKQDHLLMQSSTRIAKVDLNGTGYCSKSHQGGAYTAHLLVDDLIRFEFNKSDWRQIVEYIGLTEGDNVGNSVVSTDNSGAKSIFGRD